MKSVVIAFAAVLVAVAASAAEPTLTAGPVTLAIGMSQESLLKALPTDVQLKWTRDTLPKPVTATPTATGTNYEAKIAVNGRPATLQYSDDYGVHGSLVGASGEHVAFVVFEDGKLTSATRLLVSGTPAKPLSANAAASTIARVLGEWNARGEQPHVETTHVEGMLDEIRFVSKSRRLVVLTSGDGQTSITESIGREARPSVSYSR